MNSQVDRQGSCTQLESNDTIVSRLAQQDPVPWYNKPNLRLLYLLMLPTCLGVEMASGFDASIVNGLQAVPSWLEYYHYPHSAELGLMSAMYSLGCVSAVPFVSSIVDRTGRRFPILLGGMISMVGGILQGSALNLAMFVAARFILGFANVFCIVAASSLIAELSHPKERAVMVSLFNSSVDLGGIIAAAVTLGTFSMTSNWGWRIPSFLQLLPSLLQISFIWLLPESPRWLISNGRGGEAHAILVKYHAEGDENSCFVKAEYSQIAQTLKEEMNVAKIGWKEVFSTPGMRKRVTIATFLGLFVQWSGLGLISYYLAVILENIGIHDNRTKNLVNLARVSWSFVNGAITALIAPRYPRRRMYLACTISILVVFVAWTVANAQYSLTHSNAAAQIVLVLVFLYSPAYNLAFAALTYPYLVELFPFHVRARGIAIFQWWSRTASFVNLFVNPIGIELAGWRWYIVYCVWNAFQVVFVYFVFPETSGRTLEELTFLYEDNRESRFGLTETEALLEHREAYDTMGDDFRRGQYSGGK